MWHEGGGGGGGCGLCIIGGENVGTAIRKSSIVVLFLPCLAAFFGFHPYMALSAFLKMVTCH